MPLPVETVSQASDPSFTENSLPVLQSEGSPVACCAGMRSMLMGLWAIVTIAAIGAAAFFAGQASKSESQVQAAFPFPTIGATAAVTSEKFSMATGPVSEEAEGLFVLDHNSGLLQCSVMYPRMGQIMAKFEVNVGEALATGGKGGSYLMTTGLVDFPRASNNPIGASIVYVLDTATGNYAGYMIPFDRTAIAANRPQQNTLRMVVQGTANPVINRDALR